MKTIGSLIQSLVLCLIVLFSATPRAAELSWNNRSFQIVASEKPLADFFRELAASQGTTAVVDPEVAGAISGKFSGPASSILINVCATNGLTWYFDGTFLYIENAADVRSEIFSISGGNAKRISQTFEWMKITDSRHTFNVVDRDGRGSVYVSGSKHFISMVRKAIESVEGASTVPDNGEIRLFPLKYAWAADFKIMRSRKEVTIPGVANVLSSLFASTRGGSAVTTARPLSGSGPQRQTRMRGDDVQTDRVKSERVFPAAPGGPAGDGDLSLMMTNALGGGKPAQDLPKFHADTRLNAVIVRDIPERMGQYEKLIQAMDVRPRLIEIEVTIMDISRDTLDQLGIDWRLHTKRTDFQTGNGNSPQQSWATGPVSGESGQIAGFFDGKAANPIGALFSAAIGNSASNYLLARVQAMTSKGRAQFVARPKVLTLDNTEAVLDNLSEMHVRVQGYQDAGLFSITTGTSVRVTPLIVEENPSRGVMMSIIIEDGDLSATSVDQIPIINRRTVNTQAIVDEGQSLLIAGYSTQQSSDAVTGVPVLSDIPVLGHLFKYDEKKQVNMERFYLLTPRMVVPGASSGVDRTDVVTPEDK